MYRLLYAIRKKSLGVQFPKLKNYPTSSNLTLQNTAFKPNASALLATSGPKQGNIFKCGLKLKDNDAETIISDVTQRFGDGSASEALVMLA